MTSRSLVVLKFGGSVLADGGSIATAVQEISRQLAHHDRAIAVVSAFKAQTDLLEATARALCPRPEPDALAFYLSLGELRSAGELALGLQGAGIAAALRMPWNVGLVSNGDPLHAMPASVSHQAFRAALDKHAVVVFPGFIGLGEGGVPHVLGRGGSDLTAIFLAAELSADHCVLIKDAPGVFEWDPAREGERPRRYARISWEDAVLRCGRMLQPAHVEYARSRSVTIEVKSIGSSASTFVGPGATEFEAPPQAEQAHRGTQR